MVIWSFFFISNQLLSCTLRDDYCLQFLEYLDKHESESPIIVLLTNARIKEGQGILSYIVCCFSSSSHPTYASIFWLVQDPIHPQLAILWRLLSWLLISKWHQSKNSIRGILLMLLLIYVYCFFPWLWHWFSMYRLLELGIEVRPVLTRRSQGSS